MTTNQIVTVGALGVGVSVMGSCITGYCVYKLLNMADKEEPHDSNEYYWTCLGMVCGLGAAYTGASIVGNAFARVQDKAYGEGLNDMYKAVNRGLINVGPRNNIPAQKAEIKVQHDIPQPKPEVIPETTPITITTF